MRLTPGLGGAAAVAAISEQYAYEERVEKSWTSLKYLAMAAGGLFLILKAGDLVKRSR